MNVDLLSIDTENYNDNEHTNVKEESTTSGEDSDNQCPNNEAINLNKDPHSLCGVDTDCHDKEPIHVKEEPLGITEEEDMSDSHNDKTTIKEEPFNKYDEHIEINYNNIEAKDFDSESTKKGCDKNIKMQNEDSLRTFDENMQSNHQDTEATNRIKDPLLMCAKEARMKREDPLVTYNKNKKSIYHNMKAANPMENPLKIIDEDLKENPLSTCDKNIHYGAANPEKDTLRIGDEDLRKNSVERSSTYSIEADPQHISKIHNYAITNNIFKVKHTVKKYGCLLCGYPVLRRHSKLISSKNANVEDNSAIRKITGNVRICLHCVKSKKILAADIAPNSRKMSSNISNITQIQHTSSQDISNTVDNDLHQSKRPAINIETVTIPTDSESNTDEVDVGSPMIEEYLDSSPTKDLDDNKADIPSEHSSDSDPEWRPNNYKAEILNESTSDRSEGTAILKHKVYIRLPNFIRAPDTAHSCVFAQCRGTGRRLWHKQIRGRLLKDFNYYMPPNSRVCTSHYNTNKFEDLFNRRCIAEFNAAQIEDMFSLLKSKRLVSQVNFDNIMSIDNSILQNWMGITREELTALVDKVPELQNICRGMFGLAALLIKHHKNKSTLYVVKLLNIPRSTLEGKMRAVKQLLKNNGNILEAFLSSKTKTETTSKTTSETKSEPTPKTKTKTTPKTETETTPKTKTEMSSKIETYSETKTGITSKTRTKTTTKTETTPKTKTEITPIKTKTTRKTKTKTTPKTETPPITKTETKPRGKKQKM